MTDSTTFIGPYKRQKPVIVSWKRIPEDPWFEKKAKKFNLPHGYDTVVGFGPYFGLELRIYPELKFSGEGEDMVYRFTGKWHWAISHVAPPRRNIEFGIADTLDEAKREAEETVETVLNMELRFRLFYEEASDRIIYEWIENGEEAAIKKYKEYFDRAPTANELEDFENRMMSAFEFYYKFGNHKI